MKSKLIPTVLCVLVLLMDRPMSAFASSDQDATSIVVDVAVVRPCTFILTVLGSAAFVISLPVAIPSKSIKKVAHTLVALPAKDTFTRPVGDFEDFLE